MNIFSRILAFLMASLVFLGVKGQQVLPDSLASPEISLLICSPGHEIYELEGHAAMRIKHPSLGDVTVNWGLFDFGAPNFAYRFTKGETDYRAGAIPTQYFFEQYRREGRSVIEIPVKLTPAQADSVLTLVSINLQPQNRVYRYNYLYDNCATRPISIIERATGDSVRAVLPAEFSNGETFRSIMARYHNNYPWYQFGIDLALGSGIDKKIDGRDALFAPVMIRKVLSGDSRFNEATLIVNGIGGGPLPPTPWYLTPVFIAWLLFAICIFVTEIHQLHPKPGIWFDRIYYSIVTLAGLLLTFLIFVSVHEATSPNWLYLWLNPFAIIVVIGTGIKRLSTLVLSYQIINFAALITLCIIAATGIQSLNEAFYPLILIDLIRSANYIFRNKQCLSRKSF